MPPWTRLVCASSSTAVTLGAARVFTEMVPQGGLGAGDYLRVLQSPGQWKPNQPGGDAQDQIFSLFFRWAKPGSGFESYLEWARNDHFASLKDLVLEPEHSQGYTLGFQQALPLSGDRILSFRAEVTHLERSTTFQVRDVPPCYENHSVLPGHTQLGQIIGAAVGPGGDAQYVDATLTRELNRYFVLDNKKWNLNLALTARWR